MKNARQNRRRAAIILGLAATMLLHSFYLATGARIASGAIAEVNLSAESQTLDAFLTDLAKAEKRGADLGRKASLTRAELLAYEQSVSDLKRRATLVQNAFRQVVLKLKAAGLWDNADQTVLARVSDSRFQSIARRDGFKKSLEEAASSLSNDAGEISRPLDILRSRVKAGLEEPDFDPDNPALKSRAVRVSYGSAPAMLKAGFKCRVAWLRLGISGFRQGEPTQKATDRVGCFCDGDSQACSDLFAAQ
ncbi:MAG TPA: hypothetical protein VNO14_08240 [Blastocatellia bacterium]|nr:hypothetical protein [Blastocatellia bacterium]